MKFAERCPPIVLVCGPNTLLKERLTHMAPRQSRRIRTRLGIALGAGVLAAGGLAGSASAAVSPPHVLVALYAGSGLELAGFTPGVNLTAEVFRNGVSIGKTAGIPDSAGDLNVNPDVCWQNLTPRILPGDILQVAQGATVDTMVVKDAPVGTASIDPANPGQLVVHGTATDPVTGERPPEIDLENRLISAGPRFSNGRNRIGAPGEGFISYDAPADPANHAWTARYLGLPAGDITIATSATTTSQARVNSAAASEVTIFNNGDVAGPVAPCTEPLAENAVTAADHPVINRANVGTDLVLGGVAQPSTNSVSVVLVDGNPGTSDPTPPVTLSPSTGGPRTWTAVVPQSSVAALADGSLLAVGSYSVGGPAPIAGVNLGIPKDTVAPPAPTAVPAPGTYFTPQSVTLNHSDPDPRTRIQFTNGGGDPNAGSPIFQLPIAVTGSQLIRAVSVDAAGNASGVAAFGYQIVPQPVVIQRPAPKPPARTSFSLLHSACKPKAKLCKAGITFRLTAATRLIVAVRTAKGSRIVGAFFANGKKGPNRINLPRKLGKGKIGRGKYVVSVQAVTGSLAGGPFKTTVQVL